MEGLPFVDSTCKRTIEKTIEFLEKQIRNMEENITSLANQEYKKQMELLTSIKGIGVTLAATLIIVTGGFTYFDQVFQSSIPLAALAYSSFSSTLMLHLPSPAKAKL